MRVQLCAVLLLAFVVRLSGAVITFTWTGAVSGESGASISAVGNWSSTLNLAPTSLLDPSALVFSSISEGASSFVQVDANLDVYGLTFSGSYPSYSFVSYSRNSLGLGSGGITVGAASSSEISLYISHDLRLLANQTWNVAGPLTVYGGISGSYGITKTGSGTLTLGSNTFTGAAGAQYGFDLQQGTLLLNSSSSVDGSTIYSGPVGTNKLMLRSGTTLAASTYDVELHNALLLESGVTFGATGSLSLTLRGDTTLQTSATVINVQGDSSTTFAGGFLEPTANAGYSLTFRGAAAAILSGNNTYSGATISDGGSVVFANSGAFGSTSSVNAINNGYVGVAYDGGGMATLISKTTPASYTGSIGFESTGGTLTFADNVNLSGFDSSKFVGLGSRSSVTLSGTLTPPGGSGGTLPLVGLNGGYLNISGALASPTVSAVTIGYGTNSSTISYNGSVELSSGNSTYTGNTTLQSGYLVFGANSTLASGNVTQGPIGLGTLVVSSSAQSPGIATSVSGTTVHNNIALQGSSVLKVGVDWQSSISKFGENSLTLSGNISGTGSLETLGSSTVTLGGTNSFSGGFTAGGYGTIVVNSSSALGTGTLDTGYSTFQINTNATVGSLQGNGNIVVNNAATLQINQQQAGTFGGSIGGSGITIAKTGSETLTIGSGCATNSYTGNTVVSQGTLIVNGSTFTYGDTTYGPLGGSTIVLNGGQLKLAEGTSISNNVTVSAPSRISGNGTFSSSFTAGSNVTLAPGSSPGALTFSSNLTFSSGGTYEMEMQSASGSAGTAFDTIYVGGVLNFDTTTAPFKVDLISLSTSGVAGNVSDFSASTSYSWQIAYASGGITGFTGANTTIGTSSFSNATNNGLFWLSTSQSDKGTGAALFLNFTPVPEPSTWALLVSGLGVVLLGVRRRRRGS